MRLSFLTSRPSLTEAPLDRDGQPLARTIDAWTIGLHPNKIIGDKLDIARALARLRGRRVVVLQHEWDSLHLARRLTYIPALLLANRIIVFSPLVKQQIAADPVIGRLAPQPIDQLQIQRLKKRKLLLKDEISWLESRLIPDSIA